MVQKAESAPATGPLPALRSLSSDLRMVHSPHHSEFSSNVTSLERSSWATFSLVPRSHHPPQPLSRHLILFFIAHNTSEIHLRCASVSSLSCQSPLPGCVRLGGDISLMCVSVPSAPRIVNDWTGQAQRAMQWGLVTRGGLGEFWGREGG